MSDEQWNTGGPVDYPYGFPPARKPPPKRLWYLVGAAVAILGLLLAGIGLTSIVGGAGSRPTAEHTFRTGESTTVHIDAGESKVVYVAATTRGHRVRCAGTAADGRPIEIAPYDGSLIVNQWEAAFKATPDRAGEYTFRCHGMPSDRFGVGDDVTARSMFAGGLITVAGGSLIVVGLSLVVVNWWFRRRRTGTPTG